MSSRAEVVSALAGYYGVDALGVAANAMQLRAMEIETVAGSAIYRHPSMRSYRTRLLAEEAWLKDAESLMRAAIERTISEQG